MMIKILRRKNANSAKGNRRASKRTLQIQKKKPGLNRPGFLYSCRPSPSGA
jgi:hypothetical protein